MRLFLLRGKSEDSKNFPHAHETTEERRHANRFGVASTSITLVKDADIFHIVDLSLSGIKVKASQRVIEKLEVGGIHSAKLRLRKKLEDVQLKLEWKDISSHSMGFSFYEPTAEFHQTIVKALEPLKSALRTKWIPSENLDPTSAPTVWLKSEDGTDFSFWMSKGQKIERFRLLKPNGEFHWSLEKGALCLDKQSSTSPHLLKDFAEWTYGFLNALSFPCKNEILQILGTLNPES